MTDWRDSLIRLDQSILDALAAIHRGSRQIALVVDDQQRLQGVVTDGDIRTQIIKGLPLDRPITSLMNASPIIASPAASRGELLTLLRTHRVHQIPLLDDRRCVVGLATLDELLDERAQPNLVVLMAGGSGSRLQPLTADTPKPMLHVGARPILETIILQFKEYGFSRFVIAMHYLGDQIVRYFGDGARLDADISYLSETEPLGTAGALSLLKEQPTQPFFVMNGDLLTKLNFASLMAFHVAKGAPMTLCVREHSLTIPYGVAEIAEDRVMRLVEKPFYRHMVNAGIYACNPDILDIVPRNQPSTMVDIVQFLIAQGRAPAVFPIHEYWVDIGHHPDFQRAVADYDQVFR